MLEDLNHDECKFDAQIIIFHKEFSKDNATFPLFAFKVLSRFCGGCEVPSNAEKVVLVEKQFALRVFGQGRGCQALRCPYYLAYSASAIAAGTKDPDMLTAYGKRDLIRSNKGKCGPIEVLPQESTMPRIDLLTEEIEAEDEEEGRPLKRIKPSTNTSSSPPSPKPES